MERTHGQHAGNEGIRILRKTSAPFKVFIFDRMVTATGTYSIYYISQQASSENAVPVKSEKFAREIRNRIMADIAQSKEYRISIGADGKINVIYGPENFVPEEILKK